MALTCRKSWLLALALQMLLTAAARAQVPPYAVGSDPTAFGVTDGSIFSPSQLSLFGRGPQQNYGYFGTAEFLLWSISNPNSVHDFGVDGGSRQVYVNNATPPSTFTAATTVVFNPDSPPYPISNASLTSTFDQQEIVTTTTTQVTESNLGGNNLMNFYQNSGLTTEHNSLNTSWLAAPLSGGFRTDFGYIDEETNRGWLFSVTSMSQTQSNSTSSVSAVFEDGTHDPAIQNTVYNGLLSYTSTSGTTALLTTTTSNGSGGQSTASFPFSSLSVTTQAPIQVPQLYGFIADPLSNTTTALAQWPNGFAADLNHNGVYGAYGRDLGTGGGTTASGSNDGIPDRESAGVPPLPIDYGDLVPLPLVFTNVQSSYKSTFWSVEANRLYRMTGEDKLGGRWDVFGGVRYIDFSDIYNVIASGGILDTTTLNVNSYNRIVGPQIGFRWSKQNGKRLTFSTESRLIGGANFQTIRQNGIVGSNLTQSLISPTPTTTTIVTNGSTTNLNGTVVNPTTTNQIVFATNQANNPGQGTAAPRLNQPLTMQPTSYNSTVNHVVFNPVCELRANLNYQVFRRVSVAAGWTGLYIDGVARSSGMTNFVLPSFQLSAGNNHQGVFINGLNLSLIINR